MADLLPDRQKKMMFCLGRGFWKAYFWDLVVHFTWRRRRANERGRRTDRLEVSRVVFLGQSLFELRKREVHSRRDGAKGILVSLPDVDEQDVLPVSAAPIPPAA